MNNCLECGGRLLGRMDKKFCTDSCRNTYNNKLKAFTNNTIRNVNNALKKNRRILEEVCPVEKCKTLKKTLLSKGFDFKFFTHIRTTQKGNTYYFVYDLGYLELDNDFFLVVKDNN